MIVEFIKNKIQSGTVIPKPKAKQDFVIKGWGKRRAESALIYKIPNHTNPSKPHEKGITESEFNMAYKQLVDYGLLSRDWFNQNMQSCAKEGACNFTSIGGIFELLNLAMYERGIYLKK